jgi:uncharacterized membrane protein
MKNVNKKTLRRMKIRKKHIPLIIMITFGILIFMMGILNHYYFKTFTYDYGNYNFAFWDYSHFRISPLTPFRGNFLQDHFSFTLMYFVPVYWLMNWLTQTYTLIIIQCSLIMVAAWYTYKIIKLKTDNFWLGVGVIVYYFLLLGRYTSFASDVNLAIMSACFIPIFLYYFETRKYLIAMIILVLSLFSRENIPLWFIFIFFVLIIQHRKEKKAVLFSIAGIVVSIVYFIILFKVFIPAIESPDKQYSLFNYSALGANPGEALLFIIEHPYDAVKMFFVNHLNDPAYDGVKAEFYWVYLISGGAILFLRPQYLIWFIPIVAQKVLNDDPFRWGIATYYSIEVVTLLPISVFLTLIAIKWKNLQNSLIIVVCIATVAMTIHKLDAHNCRIPWTRVPAKEKFYDKRFYLPPFNIKNVNKLLANIPPDAKVSASNMLLPHISQRRYIYYFPTVKDAEYIVISVFDNYYLISQCENEKSRFNYLSNPKWEIVSVEYPVFLLKYNETSTSDKSALDMIWGQSDTLYCNYEQIDSTKKKVLWSNEVFAEDIDKLTNGQAYSGDYSLVLPMKDTYSSSINIDTKQLSYLQISVWCRCDEKGGFIAASGNDGFYRASFDSDSIDSSGWRRLVLSFWAPQSKDGSTINVYFGSSASVPIYFDDFQIIKRYKKLTED